MSSFDKAILSLADGKTGRLTCRTLPRQARIDIFEPYTAACRRSIPFGD